VTSAQNANGAADPAPQAEVYRAARQDKPWGHELIFAAIDGKYIGKVIHVNAGHSLSLQYHHEKEETISVTSGEALHRITAISDLDFAEVSTACPGWREDVVRLEDRYGRAGTSAP